MRIVTVLAFLALCFTVTACATKTVTLPASAEMPAAMGEAKVSKDDNGNTRIKLKVRHFAPPERLTPPRAMYVVWLETANHDMRNLGRLRINDDLEGELVTVTPYDVFQLVITAEDSAAVDVPSSQVVLKTRVIAPER